MVNTPAPLIFEAGIGVFCTALAPEKPPDVLFMPDNSLNNDYKSSNLLTSTVTNTFQLFHNMFISVLNGSMAYVVV